MGAKDNNGENAPTVLSGRASSRAAPGRASQTVRGASGTDPTVIDNLPADIPSPPRELDAIETFLDDVIDEMLGTLASGERAKP